MVFSSFEFLFRFLPVFLLIYFIVPQIFYSIVLSAERVSRQKAADWKIRFRNVILFAGSLIFYAVGEEEYVLLLFGCVLINYLLGRMMYRSAAEGRGFRQKLLLFLALGYDFGALFFFKYSGLADRLPLGISFYTFQIAAYIIDVYRGRVPAEKSLVRLGTYLTMFPQLVAGPIINYSDVRMQLSVRRTTPEQFEEGLKLLIIGLGSKVILADRIGTLWNSILSIGVSGISTPLAWMGAAAYSMQLYFDFAGYSMMAMGLGGMLGFRIPVNFRLPYMSKSVSEFWRRWHITLGKWFREYVYIPLGGNRKGKARTFLNLFVVWSLTALWHGAACNYLIWGGMLLVLLGIEKLFLLRFLEKSRVIGHLYLLFVVPLTWVAFAIGDVGQLGIYFTRLFPFVRGSAEVLDAYDFVRYLRDYWYLLAAGILFATPLPQMCYRAIRKRFLGNVIVFGILGLSIYFLAVSRNNPFMYFNF